ncbi:MAG: CinA family protein, partial [Spirochaetales bacterium]|nr:CinA family protein [Spirochaetales bacterium]
MTAQKESSVRQKYRDLTLLLIERGITVSTMESCTAGQIASLITDTEGSSAVFRGSYVAYCNDEKIRLGVPAEVIDSYGVYSE